MSDLFKNLLLSLTSASIALLGNYYLIAKPNIEVDYIKIGTEVLSKKETPLYLKSYIISRINEHSSLKIDDVSKNMDELLRNIPVRTDYGDNITYGEAIIEFLVIKNWIKKIIEKCPDCINKELFEEEYERLEREIKFD